MGQGRGKRGKKKGDHKYRGLAREERKLRGRK